MELPKTVFLKRVLTCTLGRRKPSRGIPDTRRPPGSRVRPQHRRFSQRWPPQTQNLDFQKILEFSVRRRVHLLDFSTFPPVISPPTQIMSSSETGKKKPKCNFSWSKTLFLKKNLSLEEIWGERRHFEEFWIGDLLSKAWTIKLFQHSTKSGSSKICNLI